MYVLLGLPAPMYYLITSTLFLGARLDRYRRSSASLPCVFYRFHLHSSIDEPVVLFYHRALLRGPKPTPPPPAVVRTRVAHNHQTKHRREKYTKKFYRTKKIYDIIKERGRKSVREATWATRSEC